MTAGMMVYNRGIMAIEYLKKAGGAQGAAEGGKQKAEAALSLVRERVGEILTKVRTGGEDAARAYCQELDNWHGDIIVGDAERKAAGDRIPPQLRDDINFVREQVCAFAEWQKSQMLEGQITLPGGAVCGQRHIPVSAAGCYVPGGRYAHIASAVMSVATAKTAGVPFVVAAAPPRAEHNGIHPAALYALDSCGADIVLNIGGAHGIAALAFGLFSGRRADILAGPGNQYVAEAKRMLFGGCGIDLFAGPTEILVIADDDADPDIVACDLAGQAEHGPNSPAWLISTSRKVAEEAMELVPKHIAALPDFSRDNAAASWQDYGEVVYASSREEAVKVSDDYAAEHLEVHCADRKWWLDNLRNYGSLFLGEETTVAFGDKASGPNHILPTLGAAKYTGGLSVAKFMKTTTWQEIPKSTMRQVAEVSARISRAEGMEAHARTSDIRLKKYFGNNN